MADSQDPDSVGFIQWRVSWYVAGERGSVLNFINLFDDFLIWKSKAMAKDTIRTFRVGDGRFPSSLARIGDEFGCGLRMLCFFIG